MVAALGLLALVALASEEAPFDVKDDTGTLHGPSWVSVVLLVLVVMMIAFALLLALSVRTVAGGAVRVRRRRSVVQTLVLAGIALLLLLLIHTSGTAKPKPAAPETTADTQVESAPETAGRDPGPPWAAFALGGTVLVVLAAAAITRRHLVDEPADRRDSSRDAVLASLASSIDTLAHSSDDRVAIIAAYAGAARRARPRRSAASHRRSSGGVHAPGLDLAPCQSGTSRRAHVAVLRGAIQRALPRPTAPGTSGRCPRSSAS